jgi:hypothetical protein
VGFWFFILVHQANILLCSDWLRGKMPGEGAIKDRSGDGAIKLKVYQMGVVIFISWGYKLKYVQLVRKID